jgi:hypothetical protein
MAPLILLMDQMRKEGADIDPDKIFEKLFVAFAAKAQGKK